MRWFSDESKGRPQQNPVWTYSEPMEPPGNITHLYTQVSHKYHSCVLSTELFCSTASLSGASLFENGHEANPPTLASSGGNLREAESFDQGHKASYSGEKTCLLLLHKVCRNVWTQDSSLHTGSVNITLTIICLLWDLRVGPIDHPVV